MTTIIHGLTVPEQRAATMSGDRRALELAEAQQQDRARMELALEQLPAYTHAERVCGACTEWLVFGWSRTTEDAPCRAFPSRRCRPGDHGYGPFRRR